MSATLCLVATLAGRAVAIPADVVQAVIDVDAMVPVPRAHASVVGLAAQRSRVVTVIDPARALGAADATASTRAVLLQLDGHEYALLVDDCADIAEFAVHPLPAGLSLDPAWRGIARGLVECDGAPLLLVAPAALIPQSLAA